MGRGIGSGGRTCGRGHGGQKSRSGPGIPKGFEGGQTPFYLRVPKRSARPKEPSYSLVGLDRIQHLIDTGRLKPELPITLRHLKEAGINFSSDGIKIISRVQDSQGPNAHRPLSLSIVGRSSLAKQARLLAGHLL